MTRLTLVLGAGGVGKTTLASALALANTRAGQRTVLLGADPARRLRSALGLEHVPDDGVEVQLPGAALALRATLLDPSVTLRRWTLASLGDAQAARRLAENPFFIALADRLAGFGDAIACARAVELARATPAPTDVVVDTAPGLAAMELLTRPARLKELLEGRVLQALVRLSRVGRTGRTVKALAKLSGTDALEDLGALVTALEGTLATLVTRLELSRAWLTAKDTSLVLICGPSHEAAEVALALADRLKTLKLEAAPVVLNRALPASLAAWAPPPDPAVPAAFGRYVHNQLGLQAQVKRRLEALGPVLELPESDALDAPGRLEALAALGEPLRAALHRLR